MKLSTTIKRSVANTNKQIKRSGWLAWASVLVMALAFFIATVFIILAYTSNLYLKSIENKPQIYVFFNAGTDETEIKKLNDRWLDLPEVALIDYTNEQGALSEFKDTQSRTNPEVVDSIRPNVLPASLGIRLHNISDADKIIEIITKEQTTNKNIFAVRYSQKTIDTIKTLFYWLRIGGGVMMVLLLFVIFLFTLLTVEFRTFSRAEEIGIMQLVGGSLWFIRAPFILEGAFYGFLGSLLSTSLIYILGYVVFVLNRGSGAVTFLISFFGGLQWPNFQPIHFILMFLALLLAGAMVGAFNSLVAIKRYIN